MMKKLGRFLLFPLFISITYAAFTAEAVTFADLASQLSYRTAWRNLFKGEKHVPAWVRLARGKSSPYSSVLIAGKNYVSGEMCKPHHCGSHRFYGIFSEDQKQAWGLLVTIKNTVDAIQNPSRYATYRWFGKPDDSIKAHLMGQLRADPNWK